MKCKCWPHIETSQLIYCANQLTDFYMRATLAISDWLTGFKSTKNLIFQAYLAINISLANPRKGYNLVSCSSVYFHQMKPQPLSDSF